MKERERGKKGRLKKKKLIGRRTVKIRGRGRNRGSVGEDKDMNKTLESKKKI